jgi:hypothetical protein
MDRGREKMSKEATVADARAAQGARPYPESIRFSNSPSVRIVIFVPGTGIIRPLRKKRKEGKSEIILGLKSLLLANAIGQARRPSVLAAIRLGRARLGSAHPRHGIDRGYRRPPLGAAHRCAAYGWR